VLTRAKFQHSNTGMYFLCHCMGKCILCRDKCKNELWCHQPNSSTN